MRLSPVGGCIFAEDPDRPFDDACIIWSAAVDPTVLTVSACAAGDGFFDLSGQSYSVAIDRRGQEHVVAQTPSGTLRLDVVSGTVLSGPVTLRVHLDCTNMILPRLSGLDRLLRLIGIRDPGRRPPRADTRLVRLVEALRVADALVDGASLTQISGSLRGAQCASGDWPGDGESIKSSARRKVALARQLTAKGPAAIMKGRI
ncbi:MAG: DNA -binding domain-containing protein [Sphingomonas sp.]